MAVAILGLASAISLMGVWFDVVRIAGAAYLIWLGIKLFRSKGEILSAAAAAPKGGFFLQGFVVILSNPKVLLVFGALIPQFISPKGDYMKQLLLLGISFMVIATVFDSFMLSPPAMPAHGSPRAGCALSKCQRSLPDRRRSLDGAARKVAVVCA